VRLEFTDVRGRSLYAIPQVAGLWDLLNAVKFQTAGIDKFLDKLSDFGEAGEEEE
jgi:hypothetical protein